MIQLSLILWIILASTPAQALYSFPAAPGAAMPSGCTGSAGVYTCSHLNLQDQVQFLDTGNVTITVNGSLNIGNYTIGSATQLANVTFIPKGIVTMSTATVYANINAGNNTMVITGAAFIKGHLTIANGSITAAGTITGNISATSLGSILLSSNTVVNGNVTAATGLITLNSGAVVNGNIATTTGIITLSGDNQVSATVNCNSCSMFVNGSNNTLGGDLEVGTLSGALSSDTAYHGAITAKLGSVSLGSNSTVAGNITATSTGLLGVSYISAYQSVVNGAVIATSQTSAQLFLYASTVHGAVQVTNSNALLAPLNVNVFVDSASVINNAVTVTGIIDNFGKIAGCARTTSSYLWSIVMEYNSTTAGVCCFNGSKCSTSTCVANLWNYKVNACSTPANKFTCIDPSITNDNASAGHLFTQVANASFNMDVVALTADNSVNTTYVSKGDNNKTVTLKLLDCGDPSLLANQACTGTTTEISSQDVIFTSADSGRKTVPINLANAYKNLRCQVTDANATTKVSLSTDNFAVRPAYFTEVTANANADTSHGLNVTAAPAIKAGNVFSLTASTGLSNYNGTPKIDTTKISPHTGAINTGVLAGTFTAGSNGNASGSHFTYSETGYFRFNPYGVYDDTFTQVDASAGDCIAGFLPLGNMNACAFGYVPSTPYYYGRFVPDHLLVTPGPGVTQACGAFTYYGQGTASIPGLATPFTLTAKNAAGDTTQNYTGSPSFVLSGWNNYQFSATPLNGATLSASALSPAVTGNWLKGAANIVATHMLDRPAAPVSPQIITISAQPQYIDAGVTISSTPTILSSNVTYLYGRLHIMNAHGSELLALPVQIEAQHWNGSAYVRSVGDSCTAIPLSTIVLKNYKGNLAACETHLAGSPAISHGKLGLQLTAPGVSNTGQPNTGSVDLAINLGAASSGETCLGSTPSPATGSGLSWFGPSPNARATFGIYKTPIIYMRESF